MQKANNSSCIFFALSFRIVFQNQLSNNMHLPSLCDRYSFVNVIESNCYGKISIHLTTECLLVGGILLKNCDYYD